MTAYTLRHGITQGTEGRCYGRLDVATRDDPTRCAAWVLEQWKALPSPTALWSSDLSRCEQTARQLASHWGLRLNVDPRLAELSCGEWEGRTWAEIAQHDGERLDAWMSAWQVKAPPGGETIAQLEARVAAVWPHVQEGALVVTHAGVIRALRVRDGGSWEAAMQQPVPHLAWELHATAPVR